MRSGNRAATFCKTLAMAGSAFATGVCFARERLPLSVEVLTPANRPVGSIYHLQIGSESVRFDPALDTDLQKLQSAVAVVLERKDRISSSLNSASKKYSRGLREIEYLAGAALSPSGAGDKKDVIALLLETVAAVNNDQRSPLPKSLNDVETLHLLFERLHVPVARGQTPARNLLPLSVEAASHLSGPEAPDLSRADPAESTFWQRPADIAAQDLYHGFGRAQRFDLAERMCTFAGPKESYGLNPGIEVNCEGRKVKVKFAEISAEPFAARIFSALGYHADPTDYARQVCIRYDRRLLQEFNSRKQMKIQFRVLLVLPVYTLDLQKRYDPFDYVASAVLRDGRRWSGAELKAHLFRCAVRPHPEEDASNYRPQIEALVDYLITTPANIQPEQPGVKSIGPWDFGQLDHADLRELRGVGLLAAWLGWFDTRFDNNRLRIVKQGNITQLAHYFSDLGGVLGQTSGFLLSRGELPNAFPWTFTRPPLWQGPHYLSRPLRLEGYKPIAPAPPFTAMTIDDARWMARLLAQLSEEQIVQALVASGFDSAEVRLYTEKLVSRRDRMLIDLGLNNEFCLFRPGGSDRSFSYDPKAEGPVIVNIPGQGPVQSPVSYLKVIKGKLNSTR